MPIPGGGKKDKVPGPTIRLATGVGPPDAFAKGMEARTDNPADLPAILVSYFYLEPFLENRHRYAYRDWVMDSGAFSAYNSGAEIDIHEYIDACKILMKEDKTLTEIYALDVIGDWKASHKNTEIMWSEGVPAIPCYHANEPWDVLEGLARDYPKVALGGVALAKARKKLTWAGQCFARVWKKVGPKPIHGFAFGSETAVMTLPFHSVDATNWELGPCKYGNWRAFGGQRVSVRGSQQNLRAEVEWYLDLERRAREKWKKEMMKIDEQAPTIRLAYSTGGGGENTPRAFGAAPTPRKDGKPRVAQLRAPTVRLAHKESNRPRKL